MSAHSMSDSFSDSMFRSTSRLSQDGGNNADTVSRPSGGNAQRLPSNGNACRKLQYVSGNSGLINKTFTIPLPFGCELERVRRKNCSSGQWCAGITELSGGTIDLNGGA